MDSMVPYRWMESDPGRYKTACDVARATGFEMQWAHQIGTGYLSCWSRDNRTILIQQLSDGVEVFSNHATPTRFSVLKTWLSVL